MRKLLVVAVLAALAATAPAGAAMQTILGGTFDVRSTSPVGDPSRRRVLVIGFEDVGTPNVIVGDPTIGGATLRLVLRGPSGTVEQTFTLPAAGWKSYLTRHDWPVYMGIRYGNTATGGAVRSVIVERGGYASPEGTPPPLEPKPGKFKLRIQLVGTDGPIDVAPLAPSVEGGVELTIGGGDTYCLLFGGAAGGRVVSDTTRRFGVRAPTAEGCP